MRIIAGNLKGRRLYNPSNKKIRPTTDRVKEALFSIIESNCNYYDEIVLDLFSGTGNLGIEAISRGAEKCYFSDTDRDSIRLINQNIDYCNGARDHSVVIQGDYQRTLKHVAAKEEQAKVIIVDPPYGEGIEIKAVEHIDQLNLLKKDGIIVIEHSKSTDIPETIGRYNKIKTKKYGIIVLSIFV